MAKSEIELTIIVEHDPKAIDVVRLSQGIRKALEGETVVFVGRETAVIDEVERIEYRGAR